MNRLSNREFYNKVHCAERARFYLCDFHVHSPASFDLRQGERFAALSENERLLIEQIDEGLVNDPLAYEDKAIQNFDINVYYEMLVKRKKELVEQQGISEGLDWAFIAITDHNICKYACELSNLAFSKKNENRLIILPGIELDVKFTVPQIDEDITAHLLLVFKPQESLENIHTAISQAANIHGWNFGTGIQVNDLPEFVSQIRNHPSSPGICIAAHVGSASGVREELRKSFLNYKEATYARLNGELENADNVNQEEINNKITEIKESFTNENIDSKILNILGECGFDAIQIRDKGDEPHYRRLHRFQKELGRAVPIVASDAHNVDNVLVSKISSEETSLIPFIKLSTLSNRVSPEDIFLQIRDHALRFGETRFTQAMASNVTSWISGIEVLPEASKHSVFWPFSSSEDTATDSISEKEGFIVPLSPNLNCLIGGRGSGKSAFIEALAFLFPKNNPEKGSDHDDRAIATLSGCSIRACWSFRGNKAQTKLEKSSLFISRFFDPKHKFPDSEYSDLKNKEVLKSQLPTLPIQILRIHGIEDAVEPDQLRNLFDDLCGIKIKELNTEIDNFRGKLEEQREEIIELANEIEELVDDDTPLREYARRKQEYEEVNKPETKKKYSQLDKADKALSIAKNAQAEWEELQENLEEENLYKKARLFLDNLKTKLKDKEEKNKEYLKPLNNLFENNSDEEPSLSKLIIKNIRLLKEQINAVGTFLKDASESISNTRRGLKDVLVEQGLPEGSAERQSKKTAFEAAEVALEQYNKLVNEWQELMEKRAVMFDNLQKKCKERTKLRQKTANRITKELERDLDKKVLSIEVDAQPMADKNEFIDWLEDYLDWSSLRNKSERIIALLQKNNLMPQNLHEILLQQEIEDTSILQITDISKASDGRIRDDEATRLIESVMGVELLPKEINQEDCDNDFWESLPDEIKNGLILFPYRDDEELTLNAILCLDEIIMDDIPVIRLNDRPSETNIKRPLEELSPGQRCSAILPILLLNGTGPLVIDQPEDNLDNRLIRQVVVNVLSSMKLRRQIIIATHNPNLPVLGDAEQVIVLRAIEENRSEIVTYGTLDERIVAHQITEVMEGGREAFQYRQNIYGMHWEGGVVDID